MIVVPVAPERVQLFAHGGHLAGQVTASRCAPRRGRCRRPAPPFHARGDVVGVDEQRRLRAERSDLGAEGILLAVVQQRERVGGGAHRRHAPGAAGLEVAGGAEAGDVCGPGRGDRAAFAGTSGAHLGQRTVARGADHPGRGARDGGVVIQNAEHERLEQHGLGEGALHDEHGRAGEVHLALLVTPDVPGEAVVREPVQGGGVHHALSRSHFSSASPNRNSAISLEQPAGAGDDAVTAPDRKAPGEHLEHAAAVVRCPRGSRHRASSVRSGR